MKKNRKSVIPNIFTTLNFFCGFLAIISVLEDKIISACWLIAIAAVLDVLDGQLARLTKSDSNFGIEFDSLADVISFGVAPSLLLYKIYFFQLGVLGIIISFLPLMCGAIRLAKFNIIFGGKEKTNFIGLPIPVTAISFISFVIFNYHFWGELHLSRILIPQLLLVSILMVSKVEYFVLPKVSLRQGKENSIRIVFLVFGFIILALFPQESLYPLNISYILWGLFRFLFHLVKNNGVDKQVSAA